MLLDMTTATTKSRASAADIATARRIIKAAKNGNLDSITDMLSGRRPTTATVALAGWERWRKSDSMPNTIYTQRTIILQFMATLGAEQWPVTRFTHEHINDFVNAEDGGKLANREMRIASLRSFFKYCSALGHITGNPAMLAKIKLRDLTHDQKEKRVRVPITEREYKHIIANTEGFWKFATSLSYWTGLRLNDICCLEWSSIGPNAIIVWTNKDEDRVALPLDHKLIGDGDLTLVLMEMLMSKGKGLYCFPEQRKEILDTHTRSKFSVYYGRILARLGIEGKSFHCLRHAFATRLDKAGVTVEDIGELLGHSDDKTTRGYVHK